MSLVLEYGLVRASGEANIRRLARYLDIPDHENVPGLVLLDELCWQGLVKPERGSGGWYS